MNIQELVQHSTPFLAWLADWQANLPSPDFKAAIDDPLRTAILSVDMINGFCYTGPLASARAQHRIQPIVQLVNAAYAAGVRHFLSIQEDHDPRAIEFEAYPPHGVHGTDESEAVPEYQALSFWNEFTVTHKNSISCSIGTRLNEWLDAHPNINRFIVVGVCTDLCTYQLAMHLRLRANEKQLPGVRVIVPEDCVDTYDLPVETAQQAGAMPHDADLLHLIFLYHMALNRVEIVKRIVVPETARVITAAAA